MVALAAEQLSDPSSCSGTELGEIYREHVQFVWRNARRLGCDDSWVDDAVQEVFLVVARRIDEFEHRSTMQTWLFAITYRIVRRMRRNRWRYALGLQAFAESKHESPSSMPHHQADADRELRQLLAKLSDAKRVVFILSELEGYSAVAISECLGLPLGTVHTRLRGARKDLNHWVRKLEARERSGP